MNTAIARGRLLGLEVAVITSSGETRAVNGGDCCPRRLRRGSSGRRCRERLRLVGLLLLLLSSGKAELGVISRKKDERFLKKVYYYGRREKIGLGMSIVVHRKAGGGCGHCR